MRPRRSALLPALLLAFCASLASAQTPPPPALPPQARPSAEEMQKIMDATMGAMVPMMGRMTSVMIEAQLQIAERPETAERIAIFKKNLYDALIRKGFSPAQALQITLNTAPPSATPSSK